MIIVSTFHAKKTKYSNIRRLSQDVSRSTAMTEAHSTLHDEARYDIVRPLPNIVNVEWA